MTNLTETRSSSRKPSELPHRLRKLDPDQEHEVIAAYRAGATIYELADRFGVDRKTASRILHRHHVAMRRQGLSPAQSAEASELRAAGWTLQRIGNRFNVSARTVARRLGET
ncbi:MAG: helix-turn-helix domain containing protein [Actinophytocola sp.]|nr:helix-turn-helix domain containing protein [Actinophytocola sp.]